MLRVEALQRIRKRMTREEFTRKHDHLWLIRELDARDAPPGGFRTRSSRELQRLISAGIAGGGSVDAAAGLEINPDRYGFYAVAPADAASDRVTIGRATTNDIVIWHSTVSKLHAFFRREDDGGWLLHDAGSHN